MRASSPPPPPPPPPHPPQLSKLYSSIMLLLIFQLKCEENFHKIRGPTIIIILFIYLCCFIFDLKIRPISAFHLFISSFQKGTLYQFSAFHFSFPLTNCHMLNSELCNFLFASPFYFMVKIIMQTDIHSPFFFL